jgi:hypothetical protein
VHEAVQTAEFIDEVGARSQHEMEGVAEDDLGAETLELLGRHRLDRTVGADRHEGRRLDRAVRRVHAAAARGAVGGDEFVTQRHGAVPAAPSACGARVRNIASP